LERAGAGHGQVVALVGEAGVGKSRLVYEFVHAHQTPGWLVLESASMSYGKATPYVPVIDLLKRYSHVEERDDARTIRAKVTGQLLTLDPALQDTVPALLSLLDAVSEDSPFLTLDPLQRRQRTLDALKRVLLRESQEQPLLLVFEDLHWIDAETQALLNNLVESLPTSRLLLLVNYRPEYQHGWGSKTYYTQLRLDPLPPTSAAELLRVLLGDDASFAPLHRVLIERTEGNPFFLEESVRTLVEVGVLVGVPGAYHLAPQIGAAPRGRPAVGNHRGLPLPIDIQVPATVHAVLAARIDRLPAEHKRLLQTGAVLGTEVPFPLLQAIAELSEADLHRGLANLQAAEFLYETREQAIDVRFDLRNALFPRAEFGRIEGYLRQAERLARTLKDQRRLGWVWANMSSYQLVTGGHASEAHTFAQRIELIGDTLGDVPLQVAAQHYLVLACYILGEYRGTEHACRSLIQSLQGERIREPFGVAAFPAVLSRAWLARALAEQGVFDEGDAHGHEAIRIAEALDHPYSLMFACLSLAYLDSVRGDLRQAAGLLERGVAQCQEWNITLFTPIVKASLGHVYARSGRIEEGIALLKQAVAAHESMGIGYFQSLSVVQLGEACLLADQIEDAQACADRAVMLARQRGERGHEAWAVRLLGEMTSHKDHPDVATAEAHYGTAMALAEELGMRPLAAHCHVGLGTLYAKIGRPEPARAELSTAIKLYRAMDMAYWLPPAEAALTRAEGR
jgi:tetratricopeptide (TPR) repeat protein